MAYRWDLTDRDTSTTLDELFRITSAFTPVVFVSPPNEHLELQPILSNEFSEIGGFSLIEGSRLNTIADDLHQALLQESLEEYRGIWRRLAQK